MTLKTKTLTIIGGTAIGLVAVLYVATRFLMLGNFASLEERDTRQNLERVLDTLRDDLTTLDNTCRGSANWDRAYAFVQNGDSDFVRTNIGYGAFSDAADRRLNLLLYVNAEGQIVFGEGFDLEAKNEKPIPAGVREHLQVEDALLKHPNPELGVRGFILLPQGLLLVTSRPILTTEGKGPVRGSLIIGRFLDRGEMRRLSQKTHLSLTLLRPDDPQVPAEFVALPFKAPTVPRKSGDAVAAGPEPRDVGLGPGSAADATGADSASRTLILVRPLSVDIVAGYAVLRDIYGKDASVLRVDMPREIYHRGRVSVLYFAVSLLLAGLVFVLVSLGLLKRAVLSRLTRFSASVGSIAASGDASARVSLTGNDELSSLGDATNRMLEALEQSQRQRQESEARYQTLVEHAPEAIVVLDGKTGRFIEANNNALRLFRLSKEKVLRCVLLDLSAPVQPDGRNAAESGDQKVQEALDGGTPVFEWTHRNSAGEDIPCEVRLVRLPPAHRLLVRGSITDITERKRFERSLEARTTYLNALIENSPLAIVILNSENRVEFCNPAFEQLFQYSQQEIAGAGLDELIVPVELAREAEEYSRKVEKEGESLHATTRRRRKDGTLVDVELYGVPLNVSGEIVGVYGLYLDITERKRAERELQRAMEATEAANRAKSEFVANMSHEIRTPMNGILGMIDLTLDTELTAEQREYLGMARTSAHSLLSVINDVLDFSKIEAGKLDLETIEFNLRDSLEPTMKSLALRAHEKGLELNFDVRPNVPETLVGDPSRLRQILVNLIGNAVKFTERGAVTVRVKCEAEEASSARLQFSVTDTGIGITREKEAAIFDPFTQADGSMARRYGGTGLGLTISRRLVEMMGGRIWLQSTVGQGSVFYFSARFGVGSRPNRAMPLETVKLEDLRVLVVDDNPTNQRILEEMLASWRMKPVLAEAAPIALSHLEQAVDAGRPVGLVLVDANMPGMDGFWLVEQLRQDARLAGTTIIMLTSAGQRGDGARCRALGVAAYLNKPIGRSELLNAVMRVLGTTSQEQAQPSLITRHSLREERSGLHILLAEDNLVNQTLAVRLLTKRGHDVQVAGNGREALDRLKKERFDLILMDVQMPEMDGYEATAAIREVERTAGGHIPIIAVTAHAMKGDLERCREAGMDGYITKPIRVEELLKKIEDYTRHAPLPTVAS
jgi:PAS domain S-box-containing protein